MGDMTSTERALDSVRTAPTILEGLSRGRNVALAAGADEPAAALVALREAVADQSDGVTASPPSTRSRPCRILGRWPR